MSEVFVAAAGLLIAWLVYALNSQKFYAELLVRRYDAYTELTRLAFERVKEYQNLGFADEIVAALVDRPQQAAYFRAEHNAIALFGPEMKTVIAELSNLSIRYMTACSVLKSEPSKDARKEYMVSQSAFLQQLDRVAEVASPYINLGRTGLPVATRLKLFWEDRKNDDQRGG